MTDRRSSLRRAAAALTCLLALHATAIHADEPCDQEIIRKLYEPTFVDVRDVELDTVLECLNDLHDISIGADHHALKAAKIKQSITFTYKSPTDGNTSSWPLYRALRELLGGNNLSFMIQDHKLIVTTRKVAEQWQKGYVEFVEKKK